MHFGFSRIRIARYAAAMTTLLSVLTCGSSIASSATDRVLQNVRLPTGFKIEVYADNVPGARSLAMGSRGTLFVGTRNGGNVYAVAGGSETARPVVHRLASGLNSPNGVAFRDGALYVAEFGTQAEGSKDRPGRVVKIEGDL